MSLILSLIQIIGSLGLFLYGMKILSDGLQKSAGAKLKTFLQLMTSNRFMAVFTGLLITIIIQSSSATTVMVVSFVNANLITLVQSIGVIMGANIGTTVTGWIVALVGFSMDITLISLFSIAIALPLMFSSKVKRREIAEIFLGFGLLFFGLEYLQASMPDVSQHTEVLAFLSRFEDGKLSSILICVVIGTILTCIVQSSSATMAITITMAYQGWIGVWTAAALCLGQNIGTTITAYLASLGTSTNARRAAMAHILFNVIGSIIAIIFFRPMMHMVNAITNGNIFTMTGEPLQQSLPTFLAAFHTVFNVINTIIFFPFVNQFAKIIEKLVPIKETYSEDTYHFKYIANTRMDTPEIYFLTVKQEMAKMADLCLDMFKRYEKVFESQDQSFIEKEVVELKKKEEYADQMQEQLIDFCVKLQQDSQSPTNAAMLNSLIRSIDEIESITDSIYNMTKISEDRIRKEIVFDADEKADVLEYHHLTAKFLAFIKENLGKSNFKIMRDAHEFENAMNIEHKRLSDEVHDRIQKGNVSVKAELMLLEVERNLEHIGDYCLNIAEASFAEPKHAAVLQKV